MFWIRRPEVVICIIRSLLMMKVEWKPISKKELTPSFVDDSQPIVVFSSRTFSQPFEAPLLEDWFKQLPPYFCEATLNGVQVVESERDRDKKLLQKKVVKITVLSVLLGPKDVKLGISPRLQPEGGKVIF